MREFKDRLKRNFEDYFIRVQKKNFRWQAISLDRRTEEEGGEEEEVTVFELSWLGGQPHGRRASRWRGEHWRKLEFSKVDRQIQQNLIKALRIEVPGQKSMSHLRDNYPLALLK